MSEIQEIKSYKRKKKGGKRKCVEVKGYTRKKPKQKSLHNKDNIKDESS